MLPTGPPEFLGEIAVLVSSGAFLSMTATGRNRPNRIGLEVERGLERRRLLGEPGRSAVTVLARGDGWTVEDIVCTRGREDRPFEERHAGMAIALVLAGSFQYRSVFGREVLAPGSLMLGSLGQRFECDHEHAPGDRCVAFSFTPEYFDRLAGDLGARGADRAFARGRIPPIRDTARLTAHAAAGLLGADTAWDELGIELAVRALELANQPAAASKPAGRDAEARVSESIRQIERESKARLPLPELAGQAGLSPFHYLRTFERIAGVTPHQFIRRVRLREAAIRLTLTPGRIAEIGFAAGFGDLSNFNHAFRAEFGLSPRRYRAGRSSRTERRGVTLPLRSSGSRS